MSTPPDTPVGTGRTGPGAVSPARAEIVVDLGAIAHNVATLKRAAGAAQLMTVVKADGYGHGMVPVARAARAAGADWIGVAVLDEALALRKAGDRGPLLAWLAVPGEDFEPAILAGIDVTAYSEEQLAEIVAAAERAGTLARVQLKVDTGLNRGGATQTAFPALVDAAAQAERNGRVRVTGVWSHLASADEPEDPVNQVQEDVFRAALRVVEAAGLHPEVRHLANSAATLTRPSVAFDLVRCGIATYGLSPVPHLHTSTELDLVPAMTVRARLAMVKDAPAGAGVSYGHTYVTSTDTTLGVVPVGYGDGISRHASSVAPVLAAGKVRRIAGRVCMDQFVLDLENDEARAGDVVVLFGPGDDGEPTAEEWAQACGTIAYEIVTRIGGRMTRRYVGEHTVADGHPIDTHAGNDRDDRKGDE